MHDVRENVPHVSSTCFVDPPDAPSFRIEMVPSREIGFMHQNVGEMLEDEFMDDGLEISKTTNPYPRAVTTKRTPTLLERRGVQPP